MHCYQIFSSYSSLLDKQNNLALKLNRLKQVMGTFTTLKAKYQLKLGHKT